MDKDKLIHRCNELALLGAGFVSPNPLVGAVLATPQGDIVAEGWHKKYGSTHAEVDCINNAKQNAINKFDNLTLAINLEPCTHFGKQPPCIDAIIEAKIPHVIIGMQDPNPVICGKGINQLRAAGITVEVGVSEKDCQWVNRFFCHYIATGMPYVTLKIAQTIDGFIATENGQSKYITCEESRRRTHFMRAETDATLVGINTILNDNPFLNNRLIDNSNNLKLASSQIIVLDSNLRTPADSNIFSNHNDNKKVFIVHSDEIDTGQADVKQRIDKLEAAGAILLACPTKNGQLHLRKLLSRLCVEFNIISILVEGGSNVFSSFINSGLAGELHFFVAPNIMGNGKPAFGHVSSNNLQQLRQFKIAGSFQSGIDEQIILVNQ